MVVVEYAFAQTANYSYLESECQDESKYADRKKWLFNRELDILLNGVGDENGEIVSKDAKRLVVDDEEM